MYAFVKRLAVAALVAGASLSLASSSVEAQMSARPGFMSRPNIAPATPPVFQVPPNVGAQQAAANIATLGAAYSFVPPYALSYNPYMGAAPAPFYAPYAGGLAASPYAGLSPYVGGAAFTSTPYGASTASMSAYDSLPSYASPYVQSYYPDPAGSYLRGGADVVNAQGKYLINKERALMMVEQVKQAKLETRRKEWEQREWERAHTPSWVENEEKQQALDVRRSQNSASTAEILSGAALNALLDHAAKLQAKGLGPTLDVDADVLKRINVAAGGGSVAILKNDGRLSWPAALQTPLFDQERKHINEIGPEVVKSARFGKIDAALVQDMIGDVRRMKDTLGKEVLDLAPSQYVEANRFLRQLDDATRALEQPDVANFFTQRYSAKGKNVAELVKNMARDGLHFAPAVAGDESAYLAIHRALSAYDVGLQGQVVKD
jgi:hypothetical protein